MNNVPNLSDPEERLRLKSMVHAFANNKHAIGDESVQFWLKEMEYFYESTQGKDFVLSKVSDERAFYGLIMHFLSAKNIDIWPEDIAWNAGGNRSTPVMKSFR